MPPRCSEHHQPSRPRDGFFHQSLPRPDHEDVLLRLSSDPSGGLGTSGSWRAPGHQGQAHQGARTKKRAMCRQNKVSPPISHRPGGRKGYEGGSPHNALFSTRFVPRGHQQLQPPSYKTAQSTSTTSNGDEHGNSGAAFRSREASKIPTRASAVPRTRSPAQVKHQRRPSRLPTWLSPPSRIQAHECKPM